MAASLTPCNSLSRNMCYRLDCYVPQALPLRTQKQPSRSPCEGDSGRSETATEGGGRARNMSGGSVRKAIPTMTTQQIYTVGYEGLTVPELARWSQATEHGRARHPPGSRGAVAASGTCPTSTRTSQPSSRQDAGHQLQRAGRRSSWPTRSGGLGSRAAFSTAPILSLCYESRHASRAEAAELIASATGATIQPLTAADVRGVGAAAGLLLAGRSLTTWNGGGNE